MNSRTIAEYIKIRYSAGKMPDIYFWRDKVGHEIDVLLDKGDNLIPIEIKSSKTTTQDYFKNIEYWRKLSGAEEFCF